MLTTVVADYNNKNVKFYRNGVLFSTYNSPYNMLFPDSSRAKYLGAYELSRHFTKGYLDDVRIYNRGLSAEEISEIYNKTKDGYSS